MTTPVTVATWITLCRSLGAPVLLWSLQEPEPVHRWWSVGIFLGVSLTDWLDGYVARRFDQVTDLGKILDPLVDKLLVLAPLLALLDRSLVPAWGVYCIVARELAISGWRSRQRDVQGANLWGKAKTVSQIVAIALLIAPLPARFLPWSQAIFYLAVTLTIVSGVIYLKPQRTQSGHP
ncbi:MAG: CDP-diacylglycerol--glycerol-3-phosphate 3-phosphatidyltransferase [Prochlorotrichaceae cyanobacterium]